MAQNHLKIRAAIFDVYATLMEVGPQPPDAEAQWLRLCQEFLQRAAPVSRMEFAAEAGKVIAQLHAEARGRGINWPEIQWPAVVRKVLPAVADLSPHNEAEFIFRQMQLGRTVRLGNKVSDVLKRLQDRNCILGIASNAQAYTLRELGVELEHGGMALGLFDPNVSFWSFAHGFSKPDPHVFRILTARLESCGLSPHEILMVGDRLDNDITPARLQGWKVWQVTKSPTAQGKESGDFRQLLAALG